MSYLVTARGRLSRSLCALLLGVLLALAATPGMAFEIFGIRLFGDDSQDEVDDVIGDPQPYTVEFELTGGGGDTEEALKSASNLWSEREEPASGAAGLITRAQGDYRRLLDALYAEARYGGTISISIDGSEADGLQPDASLADPADVRIAIDAGPVFGFSQARITNPAPPPSERGDRIENPADEGFREGETARSGTIVRAGRLGVAAWRQQGHAKAAVADNDVVADHGSRTVDATIALSPGPRAVYGPVSVEGTERMDPAFVARQTGLKRGTEYDPDDVERARERLARLDVFRAARIEEADEIEQDSELPMSVLVQERALRRFGVGGSYSTVDGLGLEAFWLHRNLFGRAERLRFDARISGIGESVDPEDFTYRLGTSFTKPGVYTPDTDFIARIVGEREVLEPYTRTGVSAETGFTHMFTEDLSARILLNGGHSRFEDDFGERDFTTAGVLGGVTYDSRDNPADATEGFLLEAVLEPFYEFQYANAATRMTAEGRAYRGFGEEDSVVLAGRLKVGSLVGPSIEEAPPDKLFFAGGGGSVRGYAYRNIGVATDTGIVGGRSLIEGSVELRARVTDSIGLVAFVDAGYVGAESFPDFSEDFRIGAGGGLRYMTGLGPIRADIAVPFDPGPGDPDVAFYVGIGQAF